MEQQIKKSNFIKYIVAIVGVVMLLVLNVVRLEQYGFVLMLMGILGLAVWKLIKKEGCVSNAITAILSLGVMMLLLINWKYYDTWYEYDSIWVVVAKTAVNILLVTLLCVYVKATEQEHSKCTILVMQIAFILVQVMYSGYILHFTVNYSMGVAIKAFAIDVMLSFCASLVIGMLIGYYIWGAVVWSTITTVFALVNHFVLEYRGTPIVYNDFMAAGTAKNVAGRYGFKITGEITLAILFYVCMIVLLMRLKIYKKNSMWKVKMIPVRVLLLAVGTIIFIKFNHINLNDSDELYHLSRIAWDPMIGYNQDGIVKTVIQTRNCVVLHKPHGYSKKQIDKVKQYSKGNYSDSVIKPKNIIVIMNESWSDLSVALPINTNVSCKAYYDSMNNNVIKGNVLASVWGGGTCNSEYEFLLGNSMWYTPGTYPYQTFIKDGAPSLVSTLEGQGYHSIAIHPLDKENWNRENVYSYLGFDETHYEEIIDEAQLLRRMERGLLSDAGLYEYIEQKLEKSTDEYNFVFAVTIQNHGGYTETGYENLVTCDNYASGELNQYLTLQKKTDDALEQLIKYYEDKEPTMIVMFGDHQPIFTESEMKDYTQQVRASGRIEEEEKIYKTPYLIWTNYGSGDLTVKDTSLNFLGSQMLEHAGLEMSNYNCFLLELQNNIRAMNTIGYQDLNGEYHYYNDVDDSVSDMLELYKMLMYNQLKGGTSVARDVFYLQQIKEN